MARLLLSLLIVSLLGPALLAPASGDLRGAPGLLVVLSPLLARALSGAPTGRLGAPGWRGKLALLAETLSAAVGTVTGLGTCLIGLGGLALALISVGSRSGLGWRDPIDPGVFAVAWLGGALALDLGLSVLVTRPMPWRCSPVLAPLMALPGFVAALGVAWFVARHPAQHVIPTPLLAFGVPALGLSLGVLLTGPLRPVARGVCRVGAFLTAMAAAVPGLFDTGMGFPGPAEIAVNSILAGLLAWHAVSGPAGHNRLLPPEAARGVGSVAARGRLSPRSTLTA